MWCSMKEKLGASGFWSLPSTPFLGPALLCNYHILYYVAVCAQFLGQPPGLLLATIKYLNIRYLNILDIQISCVCKHSFLPNNSWSATRSTPADLLYCPQFKYSQQWRSSHQSNFLLTEKKIPWQTDKYIFDNALFHIWCMELDLPIILTSIGQRRDKTRCRLFRKAFLDNFLKLTAT